MRSEAREVYQKSETKDKAKIEQLQRRLAKQQAQAEDCDLLVGGRVV